MRLEKVLLIAWAVLFWITQPMYARPVKVLTYSELVDKSDLVVIATPITKTTDTSELYTPDIRTSDGRGNYIELKWIGVETAFEVNAILKGDTSAKQFVLHHYRKPPPKNGGGTVNGPNHVRFDPKDETRSGCYLLFLVREPDGRYAPTDGQDDPGLKAISKLPYDFGKY